MGLRLAYETPIRWANQALDEPLALLSDHAHCELKAAVTAQALVAKNPEVPAIVSRLPRVAIEELEHFERVVRILHARGGALAPQERSPYADGLHRGSAGSRSSLLLDRLLIAHLIEARSLERFQLLGEAAEEREDMELRDLYRDLLASEASHRALFLELARGSFDGERVRVREGELRAIEAQVLRGLGFEARIHSGFTGE